MLNPKGAAIEQIDRALGNRLCAVIAKSGLGVRTDSIPALFAALRVLGGSHTTRTAARLYGATLPSVYKWAGALKGLIASGAVSLNDYILAPPAPPLLSRPPLMPSAQGAGASAAQPPPRARATAPAPTAAATAAAGTGLDAPHEVAEHVDVHTDSDEGDRCGDGDGVGLDDTPSGSALGSQSRGSGGGRSSDDEHGGAPSSPVAQHAAAPRAPGRMNRPLQLGSFGQVDGELVSRLCAIVAKSGLYVRTDSIPALFASLRVLAGSHTPRAAARLYGTSTTSVMKWSAALKSLVVAGPISLDEFNAAPLAAAASAQHADASAPPAQPRAPAPVPPGARGELAARPRPPARDGVGPHVHAEWAPPPAAPPPPPPGPHGFVRFGARPPQPQPSAGAGGAGWRPTARGEWEPTAGWMHVQQAWPTQPWPQMAWSPPPAPPAPPPQAWPRAWQQQPQPPPPPPTCWPQHCWPPPPQAWPQPQLLPPAWEAQSSEPLQPSPLPPAYRLPPPPLAQVVAARPVARPAPPPPAGARGGADEHEAAASVLLNMHTMFSDDQEHEGAVVAQAGRVAR
jgi:hypothetical protein